MNLDEQTAIRDATQQTRRPPQKPVRIVSTFSEGCDLIVALRALERACGSQEAAAAYLADLAEEETTPN